MSDLVECCFGGSPSVNLHVAVVVRLAYRVDAGLCYGYAVLCCVMVTGDVWDPLPNGPWGNSSLPDESDRKTFPMVNAQRLTKYSISKQHRGLGNMNE